MLSLQVSPSAAYLGAGPELSSSGLRMQWGKLEGGIHKRTIYKRAESAWNCKDPGGTRLIYQGQDGGR